LSSKTPLARPIASLKLAPSTPIWQLYVDGFSNTEVSKEEIVLTSPKGYDYTYGVHFEFSVTNNIVGYEVLLVGLRLVKALNVYPFHIHSN
jgi:hypothetical protein